MTKLLSFRNAITSVSSAATTCRRARRSRTRWSSDRAPQASAGFGQRTAAHHPEEHPPRYAGDETVLSCGHAKAAPCETHDHIPRRGHAYNRWVTSSSDALCREGGAWRYRRSGSAAHWQAATRHARVDSWRESSGIRENGGTAIPGRSDLENRADKPGVAAIATLGALDIAVLVSNLATPNLAVENRALRQLRSW